MSIPIADVLALEGQMIGYAEGGRLGKGVGSKSRKKAFSTSCCCIRGSFWGEPWKARVVTIVNTWLTPKLTVILDYNL